MGPLFLCGTPIGNLEDASPRVVRTLAEVDVVACEDTRRTRKLLAHHSISARELVTYNDVNERRRAPELLARLRSGTSVALVSDAGMPGLSDPGYRLVRACAEAGVEVVVVPGPTALVTALAASGLPADRFAFEGFLPRKRGERRTRLAELVTDPRTLVFYESPHRLEACLEDMLEAFGDRPAVLARELTKLHEEVRRGVLPDLLEEARRSPPRGEIVVVVGGAVGAGRPAPAPGELAARARELMAAGVGRKDALVRVAREAGVPRRSVFDALVEEREEEAP